MCRVLGVMFGSFLRPGRDRQQENASGPARLLVLEVAMTAFSGSSQQLPQVVTHTQHTLVCTHVYVHTHVHTCISCNLELFFQSCPTKAPLPC